MTEHQPGVISPPRGDQEQIEAVGTALWLLMDLFWMWERAEWATIAGALTLLAWLWVFRYLRGFAEHAANGAVVCWVAMNLLWMLSDQYEWPALRPFAAAAVGVSFLLIFAVVWKSRWNWAALRLFRRFRLR